ncbi:MAG: hypothetical protein AAF125_22680, partial [Chloroflexota bacterium]
MTIRAFIDASQEWWIPLTEELHKTYNWDFLLWTGRKQLQASVKEILPETFFLENSLAHRAVFPEDGPKVPELQPLSPNFLDQHALEIHQMYYMMDRNAHHNAYTYMERWHHLRKVFTYWNGLLDYYQPDVLVVSGITCAVYDYPLYVLCQWRNIPTLIFDYSTFKGRVLPMP